MAELMSAALSGNVEQAKKLIAARADVNEKTADGETPILWAAETGHVEFMRLLIEKKAAVRVRDNLQWTPLHRAAYCGHPEAVTLLLENGADVNCKDGLDWTPLHKAASRGHIEVMKTLLTRGADPNARDKAIMTALHQVISSGIRPSRKDIALEILIAYNAELEVSDYRGWTPLHTALWCGATKAAVFLLKCGAKTDALDRSGRDPFFYASEKEWQALNEQHSFTSRLGPETGTLRMMHPDANDINEDLKKLSFKQLFSNLLSRGAPERAPCDGNVLYLKNYFRMRHAASVEELWLGHNALLLVKAELPLSANNLQSDFWYEHLYKPSCSTNVRNVTLTEKILEDAQDAHLISRDQADSLRTSARGDGDNRADLIDFEEPVAGVYVEIFNMPTEVKLDFRVNKVTSVSSITIECVHKILQTGSSTWLRNVEEIVYEKLCEGYSYFERSTSRLEVRHHVYSVVKKNVESCLRKFKESVDQRFKGNRNSYRKKLSVRLFKVGLSLLPFVRRPVASEGSASGYVSLDENQCEQERASDGRRILKSGLRFLPTIGSPFLKTLTRCHDSAKSSGIIDISCRCYSEVLHPMTKNGFELFIDEEAALPPDVEDLLVSSVEKEFQSAEKFQDATDTAVRDVVEEQHTAMSTNVMEVARASDEKGPNELTVATAQNTEQANRKIIKSSGIDILAFMMAAFSESLLLHGEIPNQKLQQNCSRAVYPEDNPLRQFVRGMLADLALENGSNLVAEPQNVGLAAQFVAHCSTDPNMNNLAREILRFLSGRNADRVRAREYLEEARCYASLLVEDSKRELEEKAEILIHKIKSKLQEKEEVDDKKVDAWLCEGITVSDSSNEPMLSLRLYTHKNTTEKFGSAAAESRHLHDEEFQIESTTFGGKFLLSDIMALLWKSMALPDVALANTAAVAVDYCANPGTNPGEASFHGWVEPVQETESKDKSPGILKLDVPYPVVPEDDDCENIYSHVVRLGSDSGGSASTANVTDRKSLKDVLGGLECSLIFVGSEAAGD